MDRKYFDLHFEVGVDDVGRTYAKTVIGNKIAFRGEDRSVVNAVAKVLMEMERVGTWNTLAVSPHLSIFPFNGAPVTTQPSNSNKPSSKNTQKQRPADLTQVPHPDCQALCTAYDNFGNKRCKSICGHRSGL